ncbi:MAG TPA: hypothetical protein VH912_08140 [Streptosporangiaceae bacterium]|jgi:hypothetical protein
MSSSDRLLLILHVGFAIFTLGPLTAATSVTPRYIRRRDIPVLRFLVRTTRVYGVGTLGIFLFGLFLAHGDFSKVWLSASMTLFVVALALLVLIERDQRRAINALQLAVAGQTAPAIREEAAETAPAPEAEAAVEQDDEAAAEEDAPKPVPQRPPGGEVARVERGRIASLSGVVALIWVVILFLMVWYGRA